MATIQVIEELYSPPEPTQQGVTYCYLRPSRFTASNLASAPELGTGWHHKDSVEILDWDSNVNKYKRIPIYGVYGLEVNPGAGSPADYPAYLNTNLRFKFKKAAQDLDNNYYNVIVTINEVTVLNRFNKRRFVTIGVLNDADSIMSFSVNAYGQILDSDSSEFDQYGYLNFEGNNVHYRCGVSLKLHIQIVDNNWNLLPNAKFAFPFSDVDVTYDILTGYNQIGGKYSESVKPVNNCDIIYVQGNTLVDDIGHEGSWLNWKSDSNQVRDLSRYPINPLSILPPSSNLQTVTPPIRFWNGRGDNDDTGKFTGIVCLFNNVADTSIIWTGSTCGTALRGDDFLTRIRLNMNGSAAQPGYIIGPIDDPDAGQEGDVFVHTILDVWKVPNKTYVLKLNQVGGYQLVREGHSFLHWNTEPDGSGQEFNATIQYSGSTNLTLYAQWSATVTYDVYFHDGFSESGHDVIRKVTVAAGGGVPSGSIPVAGREYRYTDGSVKTFAKPGYTFQGWSGDYTHIRATTHVYAVWEFTPIWYKTNSRGWVKYKPKE